MMPQALILRAARVVVVVVVVGLYNRSGFVSVPGFMPIKMIYVDDDIANYRRISLRKISPRFPQQTQTAWSWSHSYACRQHL